MTPVNDEVTITWKRFDSYKEVSNACGVDNVKGCASYNLKNKTCTIYSLNPRGLDDIATCTLGHEAKHCFDGAYHE